MQLTKKVRIYPTEEQINVLWELSEKCRVIYNLALADRKDAWHNEKRSVKYEEQQNKLPEFKERNPEFKAVYSKTLQGVLKKLDANYKSFFALWKNGYTDARPPKFKGHKYLVTIPYNQKGFKFTGTDVTFAHKVNDVPLTFDISGAAEGLKVKQVEIFNDDPYKARGKFYVAITYEVDNTDAYFDNGEYQAIDLGVTKIVTAVNSKGELFEAKTPRNDKYWTPKIDAAKSRRDHCIGVKRGSKKSKKFVRINESVKWMSRKLSNQNKDYQHKLSKKMVHNTKANTIIVGDLSVKDMAKLKVKDGKKERRTKKKRSINRSTQNQGYLARFVGFLTYKAELVGKKVTKIDESYTSKMCCVCGKKHDMKLWNREMICDCGNHIDRDRNSAINIMMRFLSQNASGQAVNESIEKFVANLRNTGSIDDGAYTRMLSR